MYLLDNVSQAASLFSELAPVKRYLELRENINKASPELWQDIRRLELWHWKHFGGICHALEILRQNLAGNTDLPKFISSDIEFVINHEATKELDGMARELSRFVEGLSAYFLKLEAGLQVGDIDVPSSLRRELLNIKGCFIGSKELRLVQSSLSRESIDINNTELYEQEMVKRKIVIPVSPESYNLVLEIAGNENVHRKALLATKQLFDMLKIIKELLFVKVVYGDECSCHIDGESATVQYEDNPYGRLVRCHIKNMLPLMVPGQIISLMDVEATSPQYMVVLSVNWQYNGEKKESIIELTGIDLEQAGPNLLSRFK